MDTRKRTNTLTLKASGIIFILVLLMTPCYELFSQVDESQLVKDQHAQIGAGEEESKEHTLHPDAQWYPDAGFGLFLHWGISSVRAMNISWPMIPGRPLGVTRIEDQQERERIIREMDYNLNGLRPEISPLEYWYMAKDFNPDDYHPEA